MITVILSGELFQGFSVDFPDQLSTLSFQEQESIINAQIKQDLIDFLMQRNLYVLKERVDALKLHLHNPLLPNTQSYACDHPHNF
jgi:hypothetical protein